MSSEKIQELQDEVKVLKNEIKQTLLDIREYLLTQAQNPPSRAEPPAREGAAATLQQEPPGPAAESERPEPANYAPPAQRPLAARELERDLGWGEEALPPKRSPAPNGGEGHNGSPDLLTIAALPQWFVSTMSRIGEERTRAVIEVYEMMQHLPPQLKEILLRLAFLDDEESPDRKALLELDDLLTRSRNGKNGGRNGKNGKADAVAVLSAVFNGKGGIHR
jgi:hypothetical protein